MSLLTDASLVLVPSAYKTGEVLVQKPLPTRFADETGNYDGNDPTTNANLTFTRTGDTATRVNASGLIESVAADTPRIDYTGGGCGKLLLEPQRTNLVQFSEQMDNAYHTKNQASITANTSISPDGYTNADKLIPNTSNTDDHRLSAGTLTVTSGSAYTTSVFAKNGGYNVCSVRAANGGTVQVNLTTGAKTEYGSVTSSSVVDYGNGWYRISVTANASSTSYAPAILVQNSTASQYPTWSGNGTDGILIYGFQVEAGSYATSYIPTLSAAVTRGEDSALKTGISSLIGQTEGVLFIDMEFNEYDNLSKWVAFLGSGSNYIGIYTTTTSRFYVEVNNAASQQFSNSSYVFTVGQRYKLAVAYKENDFAFYINGTQVATDNSGTVPAMSQFSLQYNTTANNLTARTYNQILLFTSRLTNAQLAELTTL